jgi:hypothetical protein
MIIYFNCKSLGVKKPQIEQRPIALTLKSPCSTGELLKAIVKKELESFNHKQELSDTMMLLNAVQISKKLENGKVDFGAKYLHHKSVLTNAQATVLQAFEDGIIALFKDDKALETLDELIEVEDMDCFTLIRLSFLAGSVW